MRLNYNRAKLIGTAMLAVCLGAVTFLFALLPTESARGPLRLVHALLGPTGAQLFLVLLAVLCIVGGLRMLWLTFDGAMAVRIDARGIQVRSIYFAGLLPWSTVRGVERRVVAMWGKGPALVIDRNDDPGLFLRLVGLSNKLVIQRGLLDADDRALDAWIEASSERGRPVPARQAAPAVTPSRPVFGRRQ